MEEGVDDLNVQSFQHELEGVSGKAVEAREVRRSWFKQMSGSPPASCASMAISHALMRAFSASSHALVKYAYNLQLSNLRRPIFHSLKPNAPSSRPR
jgi:hypothetical protein